MITLILVKCVENGNFSGHDTSQAEQLRNLIIIYAYFLQIIFLFKVGLTQGGFRIKRIIYALLTQSPIRSTTYLCDFDIQSPSSIQPAQSKCFLIQNATFTHIQHCFIYDNSSLSVTSCRFLTGFRVLEKATNGNSRISDYFGRKSADNFDSMNSLSLKLFLRK